MKRTVSMKIEASPGAGLVLSERDRQIFEEGWSSRHDDEHGAAVLLLAGLCYAEVAVAQMLGGDDGLFSTVPDEWPWADEWWKPAVDPVRNLVKAGALVAAEIDRLLRDQERAFGIVRSVRETD